LKSIIDDLLALSRLESATPGLKFAPVKLAEYLHGLVDDYRRRQAGLDHRIEVRVPDDLGSIEADEEKLTQVFGNLIDNALKYTPKGTEINLGARVTEDHEVECFVHDNGPGIPAEDLGHIFERFYRVEKGRSRETGGTGLGLSIVKHVVQLHGGRVWAESSEGRGLRITLRLPRRRKN
jgi:two-component system phosphate regulon sensor histidine kinase PhoR